MVFMVLSLGLLIIFYFKNNKTENIEINPSYIQPSKEIKSLGLYDVILNLHTDIQTKIKIKVIAKEENE